MSDLTINNANRIREAINLLTHVLDNSLPKPTHYPVHKIPYELVQEFLGACCNVDILNLSKVNDIYNAYTIHSLANKREALSQNMLGRILTGMGYPIVRRSGKYLRSGLSLR